jgi:hypothetical protein
MRVMLESEVRRTTALLDRVIAFVPGDNARSIPRPRLLVGRDIACEEFDDAYRRRVRR